MVMINDLKRALELEEENLRLAEEAIAHYDLGQVSVRDDHSVFEELAAYHGEASLRASSSRKRIEEIRGQLRVMESFPAVASAFNAISQELLDRIRHHPEAIRELSPKCPGRAPNTFAVSGPSSGPRSPGDALSRSPTAGAEITLGDQHSY